MGQTLTHGIYLPDEGERNCYSGLASNWQILDTSVGTIAANTAALAGKAPLVHTHTKSDITDFPALATVATSGSYNDLSNIPTSFTPASHTHGNITNDGKIGTTANLPLITGTDGVVQAGSFGNAANTFCEGNDSRLSDARTPVAHTHSKSDVTDLFNSANTWTNTNTFQQNITYERTNFYHQVVNPCYILKDTGVEKGSLVSAAHVAYPGVWHDKNGNVLGYVRFVAYDTGLQRIEFRLSNLIKNGALDPTGLTVNSTVCLELQPSGEKSLSSEQNNDINLGTSTKKWKTLNGINPGALSLPSTVAESFNGDLTSKTGTTSNKKTWSINGWGYIFIANVAGDFISVVATSVRETYLTTGTGSGNDNIGVAFPIVSGREYSIYIKTSGSVSAYYMPTLGNV